jgi:tetratricopeptide (TPR) repeat protein
MKAIIRTLGVTLLAIVLIAPVALAGALSEGQAAEKAGKLRQALTHYVEALKSVPEGSASDRELREKIIRLAPKIHPPPAVPDEVYEYEGRAEAAINLQTYSDAVKEYKRVLLIVPWVADYYFNLGLALEGAKKPREAIRNYELYLFAAPNAEDTKQVKKNIGRLKYAMEKQNTSNSTQTSYEEPQSKLQKLAGIWRQRFGKGYNDVAYYRAEVVGNDLLFITVYDNPLPRSGKSPGDEKPKYRIRRQGNGFVGSTAAYDSTLATQEIRVAVSKDYKEIIFTEWCKDISPPKMTFTYHKCQNKNPSSCGW